MTDRVPEPVDPPASLGAVWDGAAVEFSLGSVHASAVELALFDTPGDPHESHRISLTRGADQVWRVRVEGLGPGAAYGFRVHGPYDPSQGHRFNPAKLVMDPYARSVAGTVTWDDAVYGFTRGSDGDRPDDRDSAPFVPRSVVVDPSFDWAGDVPPRRPWRETLIYECHVKGMTQRLAAVPGPLRGTYAGLAHEVVIAHLLDLGVTAVELLPVHHAVSEAARVAQGLTNYWGYNTLGFLAPDSRFATGDDGRQVREFKTMVKAFHRAGIEVILDVVFNHTAESGATGPTLSFRGIDNRVYYALDPADPAEYLDTTGTGNTMGMHHPLGRRLVRDALRYWVQEMHVDGFRFDLAPALARTAPEGFPAFFADLGADPVLRNAKLIAEPWDLGHEGYRLGQFPRGWAEWNGRFRDTVRRFWRGDAGLRSELASRLAGSSDLFDTGDRSPHASVNFVTCHDGFTLHDVVSYDHKHNEANGEDNRDGSDANWSCNWGVEGPTDDPAVLEVRRRMQRNLLTTLLLSQGVPMLSHGDELDRTQGGNNNAYCQDNPTSWLSWDRESSALALLDFTQRLVAVRRECATLRRTDFLTGGVGTNGERDVTWVGPDGKPLADADWADPHGRFLGMLLSGDRPIFVGFNADDRAYKVPLPGRGAGAWWVRCDTAERPRPSGPVQTAKITGRSVVVCEWRDA